MRGGDVFFAFVINYFKSQDPFIAAAQDILDHQTGDKLVVHEIRTLVAIHRWKDQTPRVTKDFDFLISLNLIASPEEQRRLHEVLDKLTMVNVPDEIYFEWRPSQKGQEKSAQRWQRDRDLLLKSYAYPFHLP